MDEAPTLEEVPAAESLVATPAVEELEQPDEVAGLKVYVADEVEPVANAVPPKGLEAVFAKIDDEASLGARNWASRDYGRALSAADGFETDGERTAYFLDGFAEASTKLRMLEKGQSISPKAEDRLSLEKLSYAVEGAKAYQSMGGENVPRQVMRSRPDLNTARERLEAAVSFHDIYSAEQGIFNQEGVVPMTTFGNTDQVADMFRVGKKKFARTIETNERVAQNVTLYESGNNMGEIMEETGYTQRRISADLRREGYNVKAERRLDVHDAYLMAHAEDETLTKKAWAEANHETYGVSASTIRRDLSPRAYDRALESVSAQDRDLASSL